MTQRPASDPEAIAAGAAQPGRADQREDDREGQHAWDTEVSLRRRDMTAVMPWLFLTVLALIAVALFLSSCEAHYRNCVEAISVRTAGDNSQLARLARQDVSKCSRSPF